MINQLEDRITYFKPGVECEHFSVFQIDNMKDLKRLCNMSKTLNHPIYYNGLLSYLMKSEGEVRLSPELIVTISDNFQDEEETKE
ncbi:hypothetical protein MLN87_07445 [Escherichia coli]|nr:hypothetical protein [Escherichia coli]MCN8204098.1 hypothetical protein [Escherichia coli]HAI3384520.1 hypothetical protein [Escherichia coli]HAL0004658.1 hypothetical protein [Escherichia coli]HAP1524000.1 hypothetical protein [Escherichia coli]